MPPQVSESKDSSISVAVRVRPFSDDERRCLVPVESDNTFRSDGSLSSCAQARSYNLPRGLRKILNVVDDRMLIFDPSETNRLNNMANNALDNNRSQTRVSNRVREHRFIFDRLFDEEATQEEVYNATTKPLIDNILDGFNSTVFAYGATGCGKTHTITGTPESPGIIFSTMRDLFERIEEKRDTHTIELTLSYLEIYNESIRDLLAPESSTKTLVIQEDQNKRISVSNLSIYKPESVEAVMVLILTGNSNRTISPTEANATSSRSHAVLQINIDTKPRSANLVEQHTYATLSIIDLAGSERASSTKNTGERLQEGANINKSLLALGNCINALCDPRRRNHVPYRDSKLTRLLKFSLGGNCKTVMIVCVSPSSSHYDETLNTLKYANRAKEIKTKVIRNQHNLSRHVGSYLKMITEQKIEIEELRSRETKIVDQALMKLSLQKEKNQKMMFEGLDELSRSISKHSNLQMNKSYTLAKSKILTVLKLDVDNFLDSFDRVFGIDDDSDLTEFDSILPGFSSIFPKAEALSTKFMIQIEELKKSYSRETELDYILNNSSRAISKKLSELENWTSFDILNFESHVDKLKDSVERNILYQSSVFFDQSISTSKSFKFPFTSFLYILKCCLENDTVKIESLNKVIHEVSTKFDEFLNNDINLNTSGSIFAPTPALLSPRRKAFKRSTSPLHKSPIKISKPKSPNKFVKLSKKVRWEVPSADNSSYQDDVEDESMDDNKEDDDDNNIQEDTPLHEKLRKEMNISPPATSKNIQMLKTLKTKNTSLASRKLIPPPSTDSEKTTTTTGFNFQSAFKLPPPNEEPHINFVGSLSPSRTKIDLGPPQRLFQPLRPSSDDHRATIKIGNGYMQSNLINFSNSSKMSDELDESQLSGLVENDSEMSSNINNKENEPAPTSVFGNITSIF